MKRKSLKRLLLAATTILTMAATGIGAMAAEQFTLAVTVYESGHTFEAYQVFQGVYTAEQGGTGVLSNIEWGAGIETNAEQLLTALKNDEILDKYFTDATDAAGVAKVLQNTDNFESNSDNLDRFAAIVEEKLIESSGRELLYNAEESNPGFYDTYSAQLPPGYYLVKDKDGSNLENGSYTKFILELVGDTMTFAKLDTPFLNKYIESDKGGIQRAGNYSYANADAIGSVQNFELNSMVPAMDGYNRYYFIVHDTLSKGLEFVGNVRIVIGQTELSDTAYTVETQKNGDETNLKIVFKDFIRYNAYDEITIAYQARVTENAVTGVEGNKNSAKLEYSNNPSYHYEGDKPEDDTSGNTPPTGETPETTAHVYTAKVRVAKVDEQGNSLEGAEFSLEGEGIVAIIESANRTTYSYVEMADGKYVQIDGQMVEYDDSNPTHKDLPRYNKVEVIDTVVTVDGTPSEIKASVDRNGFLVFTGLGEGTYTLTETEAPKGYNKLEAPITIKLSCEYPDPNGYPTVTTDCTWTATVDGENASVDADGTINIKIENKKGSMLPSTGGMGTTIFTVSGVILMLGAVVALIIKKKKGRS